MSLEPNNKRSVIHIFEFPFKILLAWTVITKITEKNVIPSSGKEVRNKTPSNTWEEEF